MTAPAAPAPARAAFFVLVAGLALRVLVFGFLNPQNADNHFAVIRYIHEHRRLPTPGMLNQAYHPPLYHVLAAPLLAVGGLKTVQALSLVFSLLTLAVFYGMLVRMPWLDPRLRPWCLSLAAFHPQFIIDSLVISNDSLTILLGALICSECGLQLASLERDETRAPNLKRQLLLALWLGLGLLTKYTFLAFVLPVFIIIAFANSRAGLPPRVQAVRWAGLMLLAAAVGGYRYADNFARYGSPFVSNLDFAYDWIPLQRPTWIGPATLLDVNVFKLVREPVITPSTAHSWPLMLYGSFWYSFIPDCSFLGNRTALKWIGSAIYLAALVPTLLMIGGAAAWLRGLKNAESIRTQRAQRSAEASGTVPGAARGLSPMPLRFFTLLVLGCILLIVLRTGWKYDVWSVFQGRLFFPAYAGLILLLHEGLRAVHAWRPAAFRAGRALLAALFLLFFVYFGAEIIHSVRHPVPQDFRFYMADYTLNMKAK